MPLPPARPNSKAELGFDKRKAVQWFSPPNLARTAAKVVLSLALGDYLDKRELQQSLDADVLRIDALDEAVWIDFVADTADGFDATYTVAWSVSQRCIKPDNFENELPRGDLLVLGGDQVYPYATAKEYEDRFRGPYRAAMPWCESPANRSERFHMLAIPGNHDWYDGLTGFMRMFAQGGWIGGRRLTQTRSYFAVDLPGPYWLWGIDIQNGAYVDVAQMDYFLRARRDMAPGDRLILCTAKPSWADVADDPHAYDNLRFVEKVLVPDDVTTVLMISGDKHHYARYDAAPADSPGLQRIRLTAGGGGAFLAATHKLEEEVQVPTPQPASAATPLANEEREPLVLQSRYPDKATSRALTPRALAVGWFNPVFMVIPAVFHVLLFLANMASLQDDPSPSYGQLLLGSHSPESIVLALLLWGMLAAFFDVPKGLPASKRWAYRAAIGLIHTAVHILVQGGIAWAALWVCRELGLTDPVATVAAATPAVLAMGAVIGSLTFGAYLFITFTTLGCHETEAFSSFRCENYKNFLRMKVTVEGITVYPIGIDKVCHDWDLDTGTDPEASHLKPRTGSIPARLIDGPLLLH